MGKNPLLFIQLVMQIGTEYWKFYSDLENLFHFIIYPLGWVETSQNFLVAKVQILLSYLNNRIFFFFFKIW